MHSIDPRQPVSDVTMVLYKRDAFYIIYPSPVKFEFKLCIRSSSYTGPDRVGENGYIVITHSLLIYIWELYKLLVLSTYVSTMKRIKFQYRGHVIDHNAYYYY